MDASITFAGNYSASERDQLKTLLEEDGDFSVASIKGKPVQGKKFDPIILTIANLGLATIGTFLSILSYWRSQRPKGSVKLKRGDMEITLDNVSVKEIPAITKRLAEEASSANLEIIITGAK